jgi:hypothetical protein
MATASPKIIITDNNGARELKGEELTDFLAQRELDKAEAAKLEAQVKAKANAKAALLERLGITEDEAKLLLS